MWPYRGDTQRLFLDGEQMFTKRMNEYGPVYSTWILGRRSIMIGSLDTVKWCLNQRAWPPRGCVSSLCGCPCIIEASGMMVYSTWLRSMACSKA